eukprot:gene20195-biopygen8532
MRPKGAFGASVGRPRAGGWRGGGRGQSCCRSPAGTPLAQDTFCADACPRGTPAQGWCGPRRAGGRAAGRPPHL